jgi:hypothetical protein
MRAVSDGIEVEGFGSGTGLPIALLHEGLGSVAMWRDFPLRLVKRSLGRATMGISPSSNNECGRTVACAISQRWEREDIG